VVFDLGVEEVGLGDQGEVAHAKAVGPHAHRTDHGLKKKFDNKKRERERKRIVKERERERERDHTHLADVLSFEIITSNTANTTILFHSLNVVFPSFCLLLLQISKLFFTLRSEKVSSSAFTSSSSR